MTRGGAFGELLRHWRRVHGVSQLDLSTLAGVSSRHLSFIETGRSQPSRHMVLRLGESLDLPLRHRNALLEAAGYAPVYRQSELPAPDLAPVRRALELILSSHEPFPAFVLDRSWNIVLANAAHRRLLPLLLPEKARLTEPVNVMRLVLDPALLRPRIVNWGVVAHVLGHRLHRRLRMPYVDERMRRHLEELLSLPDVRGAMSDVQVPADAAVVVPLALDLNGRRLSWFSTVATLGTPLDVTLDELEIESLFPADEATEQAARELARGES